MFGKSTLRIKLQAKLLAPYRHLCLKMACYFTDLYVLKKVTLPVKSKPIAQIKNHYRLYILNW